MKVALIKCSSHHNHWVVAGSPELEWNEENKAKAIKAIRTIPETVDIIDFYNTPLMPMMLDNYKTIEPGVTK